MSRGIKRNLGTSLNHRLVTRTPDSRRTAQRNSSRGRRDDQGEEEQPGAKATQREDVNQATADRKQARLTRRQHQPQRRRKKDEEREQDRTAAEVVQRHD